MEDYCKQQQQQRCSVGNVSSLSQSQSESHQLDDPRSATQQKLVDKSCSSYESVALS